MMLLLRCYRVALSHAQSGADTVAPSDMMDGRIKVLRADLDKHGFKELPILAYNAKYNSGFYGPFREAAQSMPSFGNRKYLSNGLPQQSGSFKGGSDGYRGRCRYG